MEAVAGNKNRLCVSVRARSTLSPPPFDLASRHLFLAFIERRSITVLSRTIPFGTVRILFFRFVLRVEPPTKARRRSTMLSHTFSTYSPSLSLSLVAHAHTRAAFLYFSGWRKSCVNLHRDRVRIWELIQTRCYCNVILSHCFVVYSDITLQFIVRSSPVRLVNESILIKCISFEITREYRDHTFPQPAEQQSDNP